MGRARAADIRMVRGLHQWALHHAVGLGHGYLPWRASEGKLACGENGGIRGQLKKIKRNVGRG
jgi:hypothetical protein